MEYWEIPLRIEDISIQDSWEITNLQTILLALDVRKRAGMHNKEIVENPLSLKYRKN